MQISNNVSYQNIQSNHKINRNNKGFTAPTNLKNDTVSFTGFHTGWLNPKNLKRLDPFVDRTMSFSASILGVETEVVTKNLESFTPLQKNFYARIVDTFNTKNFYLPKDKKEDPQQVFDLVSRIKNPKAEHFGFINNSGLNITDSAYAMEKLNYKASDIGRFNLITRDLASSHDKKAQSQVLSILESDNKNEYIRHYEDYEPYFKRHIKEEGFVKSLDEQLANGTYDAKLEKQKYSLEKQLNIFATKPKLDVDALAPYYTQESSSLLGVINNRLSPHKLKDTTGYFADLEEIYKTTTKDNYDARFAYMRSYRPLLGAHSYDKNEMSNIRKLFNMMDEDPKVMKFIKETSVRHGNVTGAEEYVKLFENTDSSKVLLHRDRVAGIFAEGKSPAERAIRFCGIQPDSRIGKLSKGIKDYFSGIGKKQSDNVAYAQHIRHRSRHSYKVLNVPKENRPLTIDSETPNLPAVRYSHPALEKPYTPIVLPKMEDIVGSKNTFRFTIPTPVKSEPKQSESLANLPAVIYNHPALNIQSKPAAAVDTAQEGAKVLKRGIFTNKTAKQPSSQKLQVISDVNNLIEKKLGKNTLADQSISYTRGATKMRLSMLPEIFESIKDTRAQKRAMGTFNKHKSESNADALELYGMINGKNKRLVNYMLKVRNEDGTRMYTVKDIISTVGEKEKSLRMAKYQGNPVSPADAKAMYNNMLVAQIAEHGKLPRAKKK